ncbi:hypothetical protein [Candidatus Kuenenia stuttgartensis]|uniref:hypothetical protein n=1 Tax=Kuenenia stuttgartiensis TaxID=174633 RepID=UPI003B968645
MKVCLADNVTDVTESHRLSESPCCLVSPDTSPSVHVQKTHPHDGQKIIKCQKRLWKLTEKTR